MISRTGTLIAAGALCAMMLGGTAALAATLAARNASSAQDAPPAQNASSVQNASPAQATPADAAPADPRLIARGKRLYIFCQACHATEAVSGSKIGPNLAGIFNRKVAILEDSVYSDALKDQDFAWNEEKLNIWLQRPANLVPGTSMVFAGLPQAQNRAALIAYLKTL